MYRNIFKTNPHIDIIFLVGYSFVSSNREIIYLFLSFTNQPLKNHATGLQRRWVERINIIINRASLLSRHVCLASLCRVPRDWWILFASRPRNRVFLCQLYAYYSCIYAVCWKYYQQRRPIKRSRPDRRNIAPFGFTSTRQSRIPPSLEQSSRVSIRA